MRNKTKYSIILTLLIISAIASIILSFIPLEQACGKSESCTIVQTSDYETTFGIKNAHIGLIAFPILILLTLFELKKSNKYTKSLLKLGLMFGSIFAIYFLYIQFFILNALCKYCLTIDIATLASLGLIFIKTKK